MAGFVASRAAPWVASRVKPLADAGRSRIQRSAGGKPGGSPERSLEELTKEELYERAQAAQIEGRSRMSKDELVRALKARGQTESS